MPEKTDQSFNPQVSEVSIGIRNLRTVVIYPLSVAQQLRMRDIIAPFLEKLFGEERTAASIIPFILEFIESNIGRFLNDVIDVKEEGIEGTEALLELITNDQLVEIIQVVYRVNFEKLSKNVKSLFEKITSKGESVSGRQAPSFADLSVDIASSISSQEGTEKEE